MKYLIRKGSQVMVDPDPDVIRQIEMLVTAGNPEGYRKLLSARPYAILFKLDPDRGLGVESLDTIEDFYRLVRIRNVIKVKS